MVILRISSIKKYQEVGLLGVCFSVQFLANSPISLLWLEIIKGEEYEATTTSSLNSQISNAIVSRICIANFITHTYIF
jgi:hypothetical protein